jgi:hypothetical protein
MHTFVCEWKARERERDLLPLSLSQPTYNLLMDISLMNFYQEGTSLRGDPFLLQQLICCWDHVRHGFRVDPDLWYHPMEEDIYFVTRLSRRGAYMPHFPTLPSSFVGETDLEYVQIYVSLHVHSNS